MQHGRWRAARARHGVGCRGTQSAADGRGGAQAGARQGRAGRAAGRAERSGHCLLGGTGVQPGRAAGQRAMHLVHSACFWPGLTQYYSLVKFFDIVREPGS